jgi:hypothetical protein
LNWQIAKINFYLKKKMENELKRTVKEEPLDIEPLVTTILETDIVVKQEEIIQPDLYQTFSAPTPKRLKLQIKTVNTKFRRVNFPIQTFNCSMCPKVFLRPPNMSDQSTKLGTEYPESINFRIKDRDKKTNINLSTELLDRIDIVDDLYQQQPTTSRAALEAGKQHMDSSNTKSLQSSSSFMNRFKDFVDTKSKTKNLDANGSFKSKCDHCGWAFESRERLLEHLEKTKHGSIEEYESSHEIISVTIPNV